MAKIDCTENQKTCIDNDVTSYPTLKFFKLNGEVEILENSLTKDLSTLPWFNDEQLNHGKGIRRKRRDSTDAVLSLNANSFQEGIKTDVTFIMFYAQ